LDKALQECLIALPSSNRHAWNLELILVLYMKMNQKEDALKIYKELEARYQDNNLPPSNLAVAAAAIGKDKYALELAHTAIDIFDPYLPYNGINFKTSEAFREINGFDQVIKRLGLIDLFQKDLLS
jgi:tetratricopeptide (TPR) repeat protein